jgi:hypothetical protein
MKEEVSAIGRHSTDSEVRYKRSMTKSSKRKRRLLVLSAAGTALLVGIAVLVTVLVTAGPGKYTKVPEIEGLTYSQARAALKSASLDIRVDPTQDVAALKVDRKKIGYQSPVKGAKAEKGSVVTVSLLDVPSKQDEKEASAADCPHHGPGAAGTRPGTGTRPRAGTSTRRSRPRLRAFGPAGRTAALSPDR